MGYNDRFNLNYGGVRIFRTRNGFNYGIKEGAIVIKKYAASSTFYIYVDGKHKSLESLAADFQCMPESIVLWRNYAWSNMTENQRKVNTTHKLCKKLKSVVTAEELVETPTIGQLAMKLEALEAEVYKVEYPVLMEQNTQAARLERAKQKQLEYCLRYGMSDALLERNMAKVVVDFYAKEDAHEAKVARQKVLVGHDVSMLIASVQHYKGKHKEATELMVSLEAQLEQAREVALAAAKSSHDNSVMLRSKQKLLSSL